MNEVRDINEWLKSNDINVRWAQSVISQIPKQYPELGKAVMGYSNRAELELVQLIDHVLKGRFPLQRQNS